jgi:hypothetical protein
LQLGNVEISRSGLMKKESSLRMDRNWMVGMGGKPINRSDILMREVAEMQKALHVLQIRQMELVELVDKLKNKITLLGGDPEQLEINF